MTGKSSSREMVDMAPWFLCWEQGLGRSREKKPLYDEDAMEWDVFKHIFRTRIYSSGICGS